MGKRRSLPKIKRTVVFYAIGTAVAINEAFIHTGPERPSVWVFIAFCYGLPGPLRYDEQKQVEKAQDSERSPRNTAGP